jgi:hypothetical protein
MLIGVRTLCANGVEHRAKPACGSQLHRIYMLGGFRVHGGKSAGFGRTRLRFRRLSKSGIAGIVVLNQLPDLFFERHLAQQTIHAGFDLGIGQFRVGGMPGLIRVAGRIRFGGLCRCIRSGRKRCQQEGSAGEGGAYAGFHPETGGRPLDQIDDMATY